MKPQKRTPKQRVEVLWNGLAFEFSWRITTPPHLLTVRLARMLDPLGDPDRLVLTNQDNATVVLCDALASHITLQAR